MTGIPRGSTDEVLEPEVSASPPGPARRSGLDRWGSWTARNPLKVIAVWVLLLVLAVISSGNFSSRITAQTNSVDGSDSGAAAALIQADFPATTAETDFAVLTSAGSTAQDPAFQALVATAVTRYRAASGVRSVVSPYTAASTLISKDGHTALIPVSLNGQAKALQAAAGSLQDVAGQLTTSGIRVYFTGYSPLASASVTQADQDLAAAETIGLPAAALVLLIAFGSVLAAALPLALGVAAILGSFGVLGVLAFFLQFSTIARTSVTMLAIALGIDYSLFIVTRFREELAATDLASRPQRAAAVGRALSTAGHAVLFSGTTVMISLAGLFLVRSPGVRTMAVGMMVGVLVMLLLSMTLLPAILGLLGPRINALALPWARASLAHPHPERSGWARLVAGVMRRPMVVALGVTALLGVVAVPALGLHYGVDTGTAAVASSPAGRGFTAVSTGFAPGLIAPVSVLTEARQGPLSDSQLNAVAAFSRQIAGDQRVAAVTSVTTILDQQVGGHDAAQLAAALARSPGSFGSLVAGGGRVTQLTVYPRYAPDADATQALVSSLRAEAAGTLGGAQLVTHFGGEPALIADITAENSRATPLVIGAVLAASFLLLLFVFRSLLLPVQAIAMNLLSVGAAFGVVVLVFQDGHGAGLLGESRTGFIQVMLPLLTFAVAFGLSMDYEVFLLSRMREEWERTGDNAAAVRLGITHTARVITSAALIMVVVFVAFLRASALETKQLGFMLAIAVLIDATVVRLFLVPSLMRLIGRWNWWAPRWLRRRSRPAGPPLPVEGQRQRGQPVG
jgi:putative drug exporter of the RND superfamily